MSEETKEYSFEKTFDVKVDENALKNFNDLIKEKGIRHFKLESDLYGILDVVLYEEYQILQQKVKQLEKEKEQLRTKVNAYEDPDDLTLFYIWLDEKAKDKIKQLEERCEYLERSNNRREDEIIELRNENVDLVSKNNQLENIRKEAIEYVTKKWYSKNTEDINKMVSLGNWQIDLLTILNKGSDKE